MTELDAYTYVGGSRTPTVLHAGVMELEAPAHLHSEASY
jgi:hypothetical protein